MSEIWNLSTLCRCCHADGHFKSLNLSLQGKNDVETYETMLRETLGIFISTQPVPLEASYTICDSCILKLRHATEFKNQVLMCEQKFNCYCNNEKFVSICDIKSEGENDESDFCNDDFIQTDEKLPLDVKKECSIEVDIENPIGKVKKEIHPITDVVNVVKNTNENGSEKKSEIPKRTLRNREKITKNKEQKNQPVTDLVNVVKNTNENGSEKRSEIPKRTLRNREKITKNKEQSKALDIYRSLTIQVDTDTGSQFSCKDCGGLYQTDKDINKHIYEVHAVVFKCEYCPKQLKTFETLKNHLNLHTGGFNCSFCPKKFASKNSLKDHLNSHTKEIFYKCHLCEKEFMYNQSLVKHLKVHAGTNKKILCELCGWSFNDQSNLNAHVRTVHEKLRPFNCKICQKSYSNIRHLRDHLKLHNGEGKLYKCDVCDHRLSCPKRMKIHRLKHDNQFMCRYCYKIFDDARLKKEHVKEVHNKNLPWMPCPVCGKIFSGKFSLNRHMNEHKGIKKFPCDICGLKFTQKVAVNRHIFRKHKPEADVDIGKTKCDICKRSFKNIDLHMDKHNNRLCACELCGKTYPNNSALNRHKAQKHFGKTFDCDSCDKKYLKKSALNTHTMKVHKIKIEKGSEEGT